MKTPALDQQIIWLTGASTGIGEALVHALQARCQHLYISARNVEQLQTLAASYNNVTALAADITQIAQLQLVADHIDARFGRLDTVIANAGTCEYVDVDAFDHRLFERVMNTNFIGLINTVEVSLPLLRKSPRGYLTAVSSSVTYLAMPRAQAYGASKAAMAHFMACMKADLAHQGIDVSVISPGFVKTPLTDQNDFPMPMRISAEDAAQAILQGLQKRPWDIHFPKRFTLLLKFMGALPSTLRFAITANMSLKKVSKDSSL